MLAAMDLTKARARRDAENSAPRRSTPASHRSPAWRDLAPCSCGLSIRSSSTRAAFGPPFLLRGL